LQAKGAKCAGEKFMPLQTTLKLVRAALETDQTISVAQRAKLMQGMREGGWCQPVGLAAASPSDSGPRILRRAEVARRLACSLRTVDKLPLKKFKLPGRVRAAGFLESDVNALLS
jgi:hypothetical protein